jgi:hypothetical protein
LKKPFEGASVIHNNESTETDFQKDFLNKQASEIVGGDVIGSIDENKPGEITHNVHEISFATIISDVAGSPEIDVKNIKRTAKRPRKDELAVAGNRTIGSNAVRALENPSGDVLPAIRPEKPKTNAVESLVNTHMASNRGGMISREYITT